jgi:hypothetical protein
MIIKTTRMNITASVWYVVFNATALVAMLKSPHTVHLLRLYQHYVSCCSWQEVQIWWCRLLFIPPRSIDHTLWKKNFLLNAIVRVLTFPLKQHWIWKKHRIMCIFLVECKANIVIPSVRMNDVCLIHRFTINIFVRVILQVSYLFFIVLM